MGIPYSKQINAAFDEVTPLVAAGFEVVQTTKNIALLTAAVQVYTGVILSLVLLVLIALLITVNPSLTAERDALVTPVVKWGAHRIIDIRWHWRSVLIGSLVILLGCAIGAVAAVGLTSKDFQGIAADEQASEGEPGDRRKEVDANEG
ncbi:hypothetical protein B0A55_01056 [Friedmanniomyces simplex]|uniref:Uncharacterized protein n=1 Tax=Friedmanniomyces simplex TaxID=329884 RepID=A0A4U0XYB4_9PEZI|nr:hypothetical protein B0A55_01056 [Friedmanniomyces simplex]